MKQCSTQGASDWRTKPCWLRQVPHVRAPTHSELTGCHPLTVLLLLLQLKDETERAKEEHEEMKQQVKRQREHEKKWESTRDTRVGTWRDYMNKGSKKKSAGHIKPPKQKTFDEDKTYVQRPIGEQHRPPPPKPAGPKK